MVPDPFAALYTGETLGGRYEIQEFINSGGFCFVFRARDADTNTDVAIKVLKQGMGADATLEFETEGRLLELLRDRSHVLTLLGSPTNTDTIQIRSVHGSAGSVPLPVRYMVVELADACLAELVVNRHSLSWTARLGLFRDTVLGVHQMHLGMIVHRDLKSENVLISMLSKNATKACVADLGRGRNLHDPPRFLADDYLAGRGDLRFAPPELLHLTGVEDPTVFRRADLYLLGSVLYELCTGQGITAIVYGDPRAVLTAAVGIDPALRSADFANRTKEHRARYEPAFLLAKQEVPTHLRDHLGKLLRQLCDPDPALREKRYKAEMKEPLWSLNWLLRRIDNLRKLENLQNASKKLHRKVA
jgi:serine/threonine protein kinase